MARKKTPSDALPPDDAQPADADAPAKPGRKAKAAPAPEEADAAPAETAAGDSSPGETPDAEAPADGEAENPGDDNGNGADSAMPMAWHEGDDSLRDMMASNFIEYASYVIKDRAIPDIDDGLKPVQRRILHTLWEQDDGRFHTVANIVGAAMRFHPHGDASIYSALVVLANKEYFIDRQGNFGNIHTGDPASAARYIECRLSPLAREVMFNPEITEYVDSYDGRNREPITLAAKVPALLMLGAEGIAVGMSTSIFPHNFNELLKGQIAILRDEPYKVYPDFLTGGIMDAAEYADGAGRIRLRARVETPDEKTVIIREVPYGTTTESLIASIEKAVRAGKIKLSSINDYTAEKVEIEITLPRGVYAEETVRLLYGHTDCEVSVNSNLIVIKENRPVVMTVGEILRHNTAKLQDDLRRELEIELGKLNVRFYEKTLAQLFIEHRIYKRIEECETLAAVQHEVREGMEKLLAVYFKKNLERFKILEYHGQSIDIPLPQTRGVSDEDIEKLLGIQIRRISLFDINKNQQEIDDILKLIEEAQDNLKHLKRFTVKFLEGLLKKYGHLYPRRTQIADLDAVNVREVALRNLKIGHDRAGQFAGYGVKNSNKDQDPLACSEYDRLVLLRSDGTYKVVPGAEKIYVGPVRHVLLADREQLYSMLYRDKKSGALYAKRFRIESYIMDKEYAALPDNCIIEAFYTTYGVQVRCEFAPKKRMQIKFVDVNFDEIEIRTASARGFKITGYEVERYTLLKRGSATPQGGDEPEPAPEGGAPGTAPTPPPAPAAANSAPAAAPEEPPPPANPQPKTRNAQPKPAKDAKKTPEKPLLRASAPSVQKNAPGKKGRKTAAAPAPAEAAAPETAEPVAVKKADKTEKPALPEPAGKPGEGEESEDHFEIRRAIVEARKAKAAAAAEPRDATPPPPPPAPQNPKPATRNPQPPPAATTHPPAGKAGLIKKRIDEESPFFLE